MRYVTATAEKPWRYVLVLVLCHIQWATPPVCPQDNTMGIQDSSVSLALGDGTKQRKSLDAQGSHTSLFASILLDISRQKLLSEGAYLCSLEFFVLVGSVSEEVYEESFGSR